MMSAMAAGVGVKVGAGVRGAGGCTGVGVLSSKKLVALQPSVISANRKNRANHGRFALLISLRLSVALNNAASSDENLVSSFDNG